MVKFKMTKVNDAKTPFAQGVMRGFHVWHFLLYLEEN